MYVYIILNFLKTIEASGFGIIEHFDNKKIITQIKQIKQTIQNVN